MKLSVIIPVFNAEKTLKRCINSIINQTYGDWEIIAINDGSIDHSLDVLDELVKIDNRIDVINQKNLGPGLARNNGLKNATGDYIVFIDADDYIDKLYFQAIVDNVVKLNPDIIFTDVVQENEEGAVIKEERMSYFRNLSKIDLIKTQMTGKMPWGACRKAVKKNLITENKIRFTNNGVGEEAVYSFNVLYYSKTILFMNVAYYHYINHPNSQSKGGGTNPWGEAVSLVKKNIEELNILDEFFDALASFAYTAFAIEIYRASVNYDFENAYKVLSNHKNILESEYDIHKLASKYLDTKVKLIIFFLRYGSLKFLIFIFKVRSLVYKNRLN